MKNISKLIFIIAITGMVSCEKNDSDNTSNPGSMTTLKQYYDKHQPQSQVFHINTANTETITGLEGTKVTFANNVFLKPNGQPAYGNVLIELKEIYTKSKMLFADKGTMTANGPLKSGGEIFLKATLESTGEELMVKDTTPSVNILFPTPVAPTDTMFAFIPANNTLPPFTWQPIIQNGVPQEALYTNSGYVFQTDTLTWINCDQPIFSSPWINFTFVPNESIYLYSTDVFLFFPQNTVIHVYNSTTGFKNQFTPLNSTFTAVAIGISNGQLYSSFKTVTMGTIDKSVNFSFQPTTETELTAKLEALN